MADENKNEAVSVLGVPILALVLVVVVTIFLITSHLVPKIKEFAEANSNYSTLMKTYTEKERTLEEYKASVPKMEASKQELSNAPQKVFFKPLESGLDTESVISSEFSEILGLITANSIKTRSIKYTYNPEDDAFVKGNAAKYNVCKLDMEMIATYSNFKNFLQELYKHDHYLDIAKIEVVPYEKNKSILLINLQLKLYAEKV